LIYESTGTPVEIGDVLTIDVDKNQVVGIKKPEASVGNGRVNCRKGYGTCRWFPSVIGAICEYKDGTRTGIVSSSGEG